MKILWYRYRASRKKSEISLHRLVQKDNVRELVFSGKVVRPQTSVSFYLLYLEAADAVFVGLCFDGLSPISIVYSVNVDYAGSTYLTSIFSIISLIRKANLKKR